MSESLAQPMGVHAGVPGFDEPEDLVNRLAQELAHAQRALAALQQKLNSASRSLAARTQELAQSRGALSLLQATLDSTSEGVLSHGQFGRTLHSNARFAQMWRIAPGKLATLTEPALLAVQLAQVRDPEAFLADVDARKARPDDEHRSIVTMTDGRVLECVARPQRLRGRRVGCITIWREISAGTHPTPACSR